MLTVGGGEKAEKSDGIQTMLGLDPGCLPPATSSGGVGQGSAREAVDPELEPEELTLEGAAEADPSAAEDGESVPCY